MLTRTNNFLLLAVLLLSVPARASDSSMDATNAICQILVRDPSPVEQFIHPRPGDVLEASMCRAGQENETHVVFFNGNHDTAVAYDLGSFKNSVLNISNYGFGKLQPNGDYSLSQTNSAGGYFESQGGLGTLHEIDEAMQKCSKQQPAVRFNWPSTNVVNI